VQSPPARPVLKVVIHTLLTTIIFCRVPPTITSNFDNSLDADILKSHRIVVKVLHTTISLTTRIFVRLIMAREEGARAVIKGIEGRIEDWKAGTFPAPNITH